MQIVFEHASGQSDVDLSPVASTATIADLAASLGLPPEQGLVVAGRVVRPELSWYEAGVRPGVIVRAPENGDDAVGPGRPGPDPPVLLMVTGGLAAGCSWPLRVGVTHVGRDPANDVVLEHATVSGRHLTLTVDDSNQVTLCALPSRNGTWVGAEAVVGCRRLAPAEVVRVGAVLLAVATTERGADVEAVLSGQAGPDGTVAFNRPPRAAPPTPPKPLRAPVVREAPPATPLSMVALVAPLCFAAVMVAVLGRLVYALFALLGPVMVLGTWAESRRRHRRTTRSHARELADEMHELRAALRDAARAETHRLLVTRPHPAELLRHAATPSPRLWERRRHHPDFLGLHAGTGRLDWQPPLDQRAGDHGPDVVEAVAAVNTLHDVPIEVPLSGGAVVGIVGDRAAALAVARSLVCQAATQSGPADLAVAVLTDAERVGDWDWGKWLPHTQAPEREGLARLLGAGRRESDVILRSLLSRWAGTGPAGPGHEGPVTMVVVDAEGLTQGAACPARSVLRGQAGPVAGVVLAASANRLPAMCSAIVEMKGSDGEADLVRPEQARPPQRFLAAGLDEPTARRWARHLARFEDVELPPERTGLPRSVALASVLGFDCGDPRAVAEAWRRSADEGTAGTVMGTCAGGEVPLDLVRASHLLITGPPGAGKSEALRTVVSGLAVRTGPDRLAVLLLDGAGPPTFGACACLPHVVGLAQGTRAVRGAVERLEQELARRERLEPGPTGDGAPPRLVVVVDGAAALGRGAPETALQLAGLVGRGTAVGVHFVVAGEDGSDRLSSAVRGGSSVSLTRAGRGLIASGAEPGVAFQAAMVTGHADDAGGGCLHVAPFVFGSRAPARDAADAARPAGGGEPGGDLDRLVAAVRTAADAEDLRPPGPSWWDDSGHRPVRRASLPELLGVADAEAIDPRQTWKPRAESDQLRAPLGTDPSGEAVWLDLKEPAVGGMGPHGLVVGATGSGKSELLRTLLTGLAVTHPPDRLCFVLVDFKGGATFADVAGLPHVAGMITNLQDDLALLDRMGAALRGEQLRRQELLRRAGGLASIRQYQERRAGGEALEPLPSLLVVVDEFAELLTSRPDFIELFVAMGRVGRSLGLHLLLASQRLDEGRLRGLESHLGYRMCLRTFSAAESRAVIGVPDAHHLPSQPGAGYLKAHPTALERFETAYVSGPHGHPEGEASGPAPSRFPSVLDVAVSRLRRGAPPAHQVWLPPLEPRFGLDRVLPPLVEDCRRGLIAGGWPGCGRLAVPVALVDDPEGQAQHPLVADFAGAEGNLAVVGAPQTGKSTFLRALVSALCLTHTPEEVQLYCVDYGGGALEVLEDFPHVSAVAGRLHPERVHRVTSQVESVLARRQVLFREHGVDSAATFRELRKAGRLPEEPLGDVFLVVDNWPALRRSSEATETAMNDLAARGLGFGVHVVVTANHWMDVGTRLKESFGGRLELRLNDPGDSAVDRRAAAGLPLGVPGRGLTKDGLQFQACLPRVDGRATTGDLHSALGDVAGRARAAWPGPPAPPVRLLPALIPFTDLPLPGSDDEGGVPVGIDEAELAPVRLDLGGPDPHFLVLGDGESGKSAFLRTLLTGLTARSPHRASTLLIDYRRSLLDTVHPDHLLDYAGAAPAATAAVLRLRDTLVARLPGPEVTSRQLRDRSWWSGPEVYVVVDDYDLVATPAGNPLAPLVDLLAQGRDVGLHLVLARRVAGFSRAVFEPVLQRMKDLATPGLVLSGDRQEGPLLGPHRALEQPPGRGLLVRRRQAPLLVQVAWVPP